MRKSEIIEAISQGITHPCSLRAINEIYDVLMKDVLPRALKKEGEFNLYGLGVLKVVKRGTRIGRNFQTDELVKIPPRKVIICRVSKMLKDAVLPAAKTTPDKPRSVPQKASAKKHGNTAIAKPARRVTGRQRA